MTTPRCRARDIAPAELFGTTPPGPLNAITDVTGVRVAHTTLIEDSPRGAVRTGVTAVLPNAGDVFMDRMLGGGYVLNGAGEVAGFTQLVEWGLLESPILLTNTLSMGTCADAVVGSLLDRYPSIGREHDVVIPVVGECDDSWLNDIGGRHIKEAHVHAAIDAAVTGPVEEGNVGGGTGMITCDFKGGIGTSSRVVSEKAGGYTVGVLVMSNFGVMEELRFCGLPIGKHLSPSVPNEYRRQENYGSIITVIATDAPLMPVQICRLAKRAGMGIARVGSHAAHGSGEIIVGFSTANTIHRQHTGLTYQMTVLLEHHINALYQATIEATEEAILNALCMADDMTGLNDRTVKGLPLDQTQDLIARMVRL